MAKIHYDELTVGVPSKASSVNYENADGTKESVQSKISKIENDVGKSKQDIKGSQGRNLIPYPYFDGMRKTNNGITFTVNDDGSVTANGTATALAKFQFFSPTANETLWLKVDVNKKYSLSGCPQGGSSTTYNLYTAYYDGSWKTYGQDVGGGLIISPIRTYMTVYIGIASGTTVNNLIFKPMLEEGTASHAYEPTTESNVTLKQNIADQQLEILALQNDALLTKRYTVSVGSDKYDSFYFGGVNLKTDIETYGNPISAIIRGSTSFSAFGCAFVGADRMSLRVFTVSANEQVTVDVTYSKKALI